MFRRRTAPADERAATGEPTAADEPAAASGEPAAERRGAAPRRTAGGGAVAGAAAAGTTAAGTLLVTLGRLVRLIAGLIFLLIVLGIILYDLKANGNNSIVKAIHDAANFFASPFNGIFSPKGLRTRLSINWGIAAVVYLIAGSIIAAIIASPGHGLRRAGGERRRY